MNLHVSQYPAGTQFPAGLGRSTVLPDLDYETFSEAGYFFDEAKNKWHGPPNAAGAKKGLTVVGAANYATHPSTEVLKLAYNLKDGTGHKRWQPGMPPPYDLIEHVRAGHLVEAWNSSFEWWIWNYVCVPKYGWPPLSYLQMRCAQAKARAHCFPGKLELAGSVMDLQVQKDKRGSDLLKKYSVPRQPTAGDPSRRWALLPGTPDDKAMTEYNDTDIVTEAEASYRCPDLEGEELDFWLADQLINRRGVAVDIGPLHDCAAIVRSCIDTFNAELAQLTGGIVTEASKLPALKAWLSTRGIHMGDGKGAMDEEAIEGAIKKIDAWLVLAPGEPMAHEARRALELRQLVGSASVKKVFAMINTLSPWGRLHDLFNYHGARTGRPTGEGPQPTNLPKAGPRVFRCLCGRHHGGHCQSCPWCGLVVPTGRKPAEWGPEAVEDALTVIKTRNLDTVRAVFGDALLTVSGCLRGLFVAAEGKDLVCSDFSSIEGVVTAALAGEEWRMEMFATHGKAYELSVSKITGTPFAEIMAHAGYDTSLPEWWKDENRKHKGPHHPQRQTIGKVAELACFTAETEVLTERGYVAIVDVLSTDRLWDGVEWVNHAGVIPKGLRAVLRLDGIQVTQNHPISCGHSWREAKLLASDRSILAQALAFGSANLPSLARRKKAENAGSRFNAIAGQRLTLSLSPTSLKAHLRGATLALKKRLVRTLKNTSRMQTSCLTTNTVDVCSTDWRQQLAGAIGRRTGRIKTMGVGGFSSAKSGDKTDALFCATLSRLTDGTTQNLNLTGARSTAPMPRATCDSLAKPTTPKTNEACPPCNGESQNLKLVYDIAHAGPRNRFTIRTNSGHLVVHNSGFGGWIGAWARFGADEFMTEEEMKAAILAWRKASPEIVEFWGGQERGEWGAKYPELFGLEGMAIAACLNAGTPYPVMRRDGTHTGVTYLKHGDALYCQIPSGRVLTYHRPRLEPNMRAWGGQYSLSYEGYNTNAMMGAVGWVTINTYSGKLAENVVQATARDIQRYAMLGLERAGYNIVLHVYDEIVCEVPQGFGSIEEMERIMSTMPAWATYRGAPWPIKANGGWRGRRYRKA